MLYFAPGGLSSSNQVQNQAAYPGKKRSQRYYRDATDSEFHYRTGEAEPDVKGGGEYKRRSVFMSESNNSDHYTALWNSGF